MVTAVQVERSFDGTEPAAETDEPKSHPVRRRPGGWLKLGLAVTLVLVTGFLVVDQLSDSSGADRRGDLAQVLVHSIERSDFDAFITESGDVESSDNLEIVCELEAPPGAAGTRILEVVDEGTIVKKGDFLVAFDDTALKQRLIEQETLVATDDAAVIEAQSESQKAVQTLNEYVEGTYLVEKETFEANLLTAQSLVKTHKDQLDHLQKMYRKGFVSRLQMETQAENVEIANKAVRVAEIKLLALQKYTRAKFIAEYKAEIAKRDAFLKSAKRKLDLSRAKLAELNEQKENCRILAPKAGQVVYANDYERRDNVVIEEGAEIRKRQVVLRLPDPTQMRVAAKINDSKLNRIQVGNSARIVLDINPDLPLSGELAEINPFPFPRRWHGAPIEYGAKITVKNPPRDLRPGQRVKVHIFVAHKDDALQAPIQSVVERDGKHYCLVRSQKPTWELRQVTVGPNNDSFVVVETGLKVGDEVAINPELLWDDSAGDIPEPGQDSSPSGAADVVRTGP
jgi:HlyD family secretion protein